MQVDSSTKDLIQGSDQDDEIRRVARTTLVRIFRFVSRERVAAFRDVCWRLGDSIDEFLKKNPKSKRMVRPTGKMVKGVEKVLHNFVGRDPEKLSALNFFIDPILSAMESAPAGVLEPVSNQEGPISSERSKDFRRAVHVLLRGFPGRPADADKQEIYRQALELHETKRLSYAQIARKLLPEEYEGNPQNATAQIKAGIKRLKTKENGNKNTPPLSS